MNIIRIKMQVRTTGLGKIRTNGTLEGHGDMVTWDWASDCWRHIRHDLIPHFLHGSTPVRTLH